MRGDCNTCKHYEGDCGHHFVDSNNHINFDCPDEACCDKCGNCFFYEHKKQKRSPRIPIERIKQLREEVGKSESVELNGNPAFRTGFHGGYEYKRLDVLMLIDEMIREYEGGE